MVVVLVCLGFSKPQRLVAHNLAVLEVSQNLHCH